VNSEVVALQGKNNVTAVPDRKAFAVIEVFSKKVNKGALLR